MCIVIIISKTSCPLNSLDSLLTILNYRGRTVSLHLVNIVEHNPQESQFDGHVILTIPTEQLGLKLPLTSSHNRLRTFITAMTPKYGQHYAWLLLQLEAQRFSLQRLVPSLLPSWHGLPLARANQAVQEPLHSYPSAKTALLSGMMPVFQIPQEAGPPPAQPLVPRPGRQHHVVHQEAHQCKPVVQAAQQAL